MIEPSLFRAAAVLLAATLGPGIFHLAARTLSGGRREGIASSFGNGLGGLVHEGLRSALVLASAGAFTALKLVGEACLTGIGGRTILAARRDARAVEEGLAPASPMGSRRAFRENVVVEAPNPGAAAFVLAFLPQLVVSASHVAPGLAVLGPVPVTLNTSAEGAARRRTGWR